MSLFVEFLNNLLYILNYVCVGTFFFNYQRRYCKYEKCVLLLLALISTIVMSYPFLGLKIVSHNVCVVTILTIFLKEKIKTLIGFYIGLTAALSMLTTMFAMLVKEIVGHSMFSMEEGIVNLFAHTLLLIYILVLGKFFKKRYPNGLKKIGKLYLFLFVIILLMDATIVVLLDVYVVNAINTSKKLLLTLTYVGVVVGILVQLILLINTLVTRNIHKENEELAKQFLESQKEHYQYLEKREYETKKFRHDIKNHLMLVENLISTKKYDEAEEYLKTLNLKILPIGSKISVNNGIADAIFNRFYMEAEENGVMLIVKGHFPMTCYITAYDLCTILSNLLSNAIQAEHEAGGKEVLVNIKYTDSNVMIAIENDYIHELNESDGVFKSTKTDNLRHGYGLHNVNECVEKNGGFISISTENRRFKVKVMLVNENGEEL